jgi:crotonobetainyl-CoA:carnitine CoA-transferase CaiB-like acyl-CoA transferase
MAMSDAPDRDSWGPRIVDFSTHMSGPMASHLLAEGGANVIKVENPRTGDGNRGLGPLVHDRGIFHATLNSGTRSVAVSTRSPHWPELVAALTAWADAVIVGSRPLDAAKRGLDFASLVRHNPRLVYCLISGFGEEGPWRDVTAHGQTIDAFAGLVPIEWTDGQPTTMRGWRSTGAALAGVFAALGVQSALYRVLRGQPAQHVSVSLWGSAMWWSWRDVACLANLDSPWNDYDSLGSRYATYATVDGRVVLCCPIERRFWERFCDILDLPDAWKQRGSWESSGMDFGAGDNETEERELIAAKIGARELAELVEVLIANEIPFAPLLTIEEALSSEHASANEVLRTVGVNGREARVAASPIRLRPAGGPEVPVPIGPAPELGADTRAVLAELGLERLAGKL